MPNKLIYNKRAKGMSAAAKIRVGVVNAPHTEAKQYNITKIIGQRPPVIYKKAARVIYAYATSTPIPKVTDKKLTSQPP